MFKFMNLKDFVTNLATALVTSFLGLVLSAYTIYYTTNGVMSISHSYSSDSKNISITIENFSREPSDYKIWFVANNVRLIANSRNANIVIEEEAGRAGSLLIIRGLPGKSTSSLILALSIDKDSGEIKLLQPSSGYEIKDLDKSSQNYDFTPPLVITAFMFIIYMIILSHSDKRRLEQKAEVDALQQKLDRVEENLEQTRSGLSQLSDSLHTKNQRIRLYLGRFIKAIQAENDFLRNCIKVVFRNSGVSHQNSRALLGEISKKFRSNIVPAHYTSFSLDDTMEILIDEMRRSEFDKTAKYSRDKNTE